MAYKVEITDSAKEELDAIVRYFVETLANPISAGKLLDDFYKQKVIFAMTRICFLFVLCKVCNEKDTEDFYL